MGQKSRQKREAKDKDKLITVAVPSGFKEKPILLTTPKMGDLAAYGPAMLRALAEGYKQGLDEPCVLVIWRGSPYAKEHGLDKSATPLIIQPISGPDLERLTGSPAYPSRSARDSLPSYTFALATADGVEDNISVDFSDESAILSWRYSRAYRQQVVTDKEMEPAVRELERLTGISRND